LPDQRLAGQLRGQLRLAGSLAQPEAAGDIVLADGLYENFVTGTLLMPLAGRLVIDRDRTASLTLAAQTPGGGRLAVDGTGRMGEAGAPQLDLRAQFVDARLVARDDVVATLAGELGYRGGLDRGTLDGRLTVTPVEIFLRDRLPPSVVVLPVTEINRPGGDPPPPAAAAPSAAPAIDLAIALDLPRRIFVRGRGLESEWSGALTVGGTSSEPRLTGDISLVRGVFSFASKRFQLQRGTVSFLGGRSIDPLLDLAAEYRTSELTAVIAVRGPASDPALEVTSQPPLPQSEVLAQVMFGKATTRLSPFEAVQLAAALDALARGDTWTEDALGSIRQFLGLDVLTVDSGTGDEKGPAVEVGRYLGDRVYVGARRGLTDDTSGGRVEVEILPGLSLQSDILQDVEGTTGSIGLRWKHDY
jgi:translocation and assembly module TamB